MSAQIAASVGARVALIERARTGGDWLWTGRVPSKSLIAAAGLAHRMRTAGDVGLAPTELRELPCSSLCSAGARSAVSSARRSRAAVTLVEMADRLLLKEEPEAGALIARRLAAEGVDVRLRPRRSRSVARRSSSSSRPTARPTRSRSTAC